MENSAMDMTTAICSSNNVTTPESTFTKASYEIILQENHELKNKVKVLERANKELENEINFNLKCGGKSDLDVSVSLDVTSSKVIFQENYQLKKRIEILEKVNSELESDINYMTHKQAKETTRSLNIQEELELANSKIKHLESRLDEERIQTQRLIQEVKESEESKPETKPAVIVQDQEQLNILTQHIEKLEIQREEDQHIVKEITEEKDKLMEKLNLLITEKSELQSEVSELKELLNQKTAEIRNLNGVIDSLREEKLLMNTELQLLKASDSNAPRGNSLFAEVEDNRQKIAAQRELLKMKYLNLKKVFNQKQAENNKLKLEIVKIRREEKEDEKTVHRDYSTLIETYKQRVWELEERVKELENKPEYQPVSMSNSDDSHWNWVNTMVENARKETRNLQAELDRRGSHYVTQGHQLLEAQKENRRLKATVAKLQSNIDELRLQLDTINSAKEDQDGISPPSTEIAVEYQKQKIVRFKESLSEYVKNNSKHNISSSDADSSMSEQNKSVKETNTFQVKGEDSNNSLSENNKSGKGINTLQTKVKEENKENLGY